MDLHYCKKKIGSTSSCSNLAKYISTTINKHTESQNSELKKCFRCEEHKNTSTANRKVINTEEINQTENIKQVNIFLNKYIGKEVYSSRERNKYPFIGKYIKDNGGIMCYNEFTKKYKFVYYYQIQNK